MQYKVEEPAPLKKQVEVTVPAADVDKQIESLAARYRATVAIPGFRKGKAPLNRVLAQFAKDIYAEATENLINEQFDRIVGELKLEPASRANFKVASLTRGQDFTYSFSLDVMPEFTLPDYADFPVREEEVEVSAEEVDNVIENARRDLARLVPVEEKRAPQDGDVVNLDVAGFDAEGAEVPGLKVAGMDMTIGEKQIFDSFENFVKTIPVGEEKEEKILFPQSFANPDFSEKEFLLRIKVNAINMRELPELNDEFAAKLGQYETIGAVRDIIGNAFKLTREKMNRGSAQTRMLGELLEKVEFPLPESLVEHFTRVAQANSLEALQRQGADLGDADIRTQILELARKEAEQRVREYVFLYRVAQAEGIEVAENEITQYLQQVAASSRRPFAAVRDEYIDNNLMGVAHDRIMSDKALNAIYAKAKVEKVSPGTFVPAGADGENAAEKPGARAKADLQAKDAAPAKPEGDSVE
ncbi:MAG: trigger factor [Deltaproteobacteria bacterium]|nr:trigger factor [Deltaproteobacteria bacterium]